MKMVPGTPVCALVRFAISTRMSSRSSSANDVSAGTWSISLVFMITIGTNFRRLPGGQMLAIDWEAIANGRYRGKNVYDDRRSTLHATAPPPAPLHCAAMTNRRDLFPPIEPTRTGQLRLDPRH